MFLPEPVGEELDGGVLLAAQLAGADAQLIGHHLLSELLDETAEQRLVRPPTAIQRVLVQVVRAQRLDAIEQDLPQGCRTIKAIGKAKELNQRVAAKMVGMIEVAERIA